MTHHNLLLNDNVVTVSATHGGKTRIINNLLSIANHQNSCFVVYEMKSNFNLLSANCSHVIYILNPLQINTARFKVF